jgi:hypothetical protein
MLCGMTIDTGTNSDSDIPTLKVRGPADLVQAIPYLLGFHPVGSLVLVGLERSRVMVTARLDLVDLALPAVLADAVAGMYRGGARDFVAVIFDDDAVPQATCSTESLPWRGAAAEVREVVEGIGGIIGDIVLVSRKRMWSYVCADPACCPPEGTALADSSAVAAAATYAGLVALPDRASVAKLLDPWPDTDRDRLGPALRAAERATLTMVLRGEIDRENRSVKRALFGACRAGDVPGATPTQSDDQVVRYAVALRRYEVRDSLWLAVDDGRIDGRVLWRYLAQRLPGPYAAAALFLFAWSSYRAGDGALAGMAAQRALESDSRYSAADLLLAALAHAVDPRHMPKLRSRGSG